jgi:6-pyruvoyltetrahydropterin/6-carboxytetrahydropterin synthase
MRTRLGLDYHFEAAHFLPNVADGHKCKRMHGHSYTVVVTVEGEVDPAMGWVIDFGDIDVVVGPVIAGLDHRLLNELPGLANPTSELLAAWLWNRSSRAADPRRDLGVRDPGVPLRGARV